MGKKKGGKSAAGRAKQKQRAWKSSGSPWSQGNRAFGRNNDSWSDDDADGTFNFRGFSQTRSPAIPTPSTSTLAPRHRKVAFVSAGISTPPLEKKHTLEVGEDVEDEDASEETDDDLDVDDSNIMTNITIEMNTVPMNVETPHDTAMPDVNVPNRRMAEMSIQEHVEEPAGPSFVVDVMGDESLADTTGLIATAQRAASPAPSDSSEEVIVFHGRRAAKVVNDPVQATSMKRRPDEQPEHPRRAEPEKAASFVRTTSDPQSNPASKLDSESLCSKQSPTTNITEAESTGNTFSILDSWQLHSLLDRRPAETLGIPQYRVGDDEVADQKWRPAPPGAWWRNQNAEKDKPALQKTPHENAQNGAEETITSLQHEIKQRLREKKAARKISMPNHNQHDVAARTPSRRGKKTRKAHNRALRATNIISDDAAAAEAAYDDYMQNLAQQLDGADEDEQKAQGGLETSVLSGMQAFAGTNSLGGPSLVVNGEEILDDEFLVHDKGQTTDTGDNSSWASQDSDDLTSDLSDDRDDSELEDEIEYNEQEIFEDEEDLRQRRIESMEDEVIARLFAKQQEFGIDGDELMIEDGDYVDGIGDLEAARAGLSNINIPLRAAKQSRRRGRQTHFPNASALADSVDQYGQNGFDIMDFDRPSLRPTKKGRKGKMPAALESLSDEELQNNMQETWENDRRKKSQKKLEREELRAQGLLGKAGRSGKSDLKAKYATGISIQQVFEELADFLLHDELEQRAFPPMGKADRKALHDICGKLNMNSRSQGAGNKRFPVLTKTQHTPRPGEPGCDNFIAEVQAGHVVNIGHAYRMSKVLGRVRKGKEPKVMRASRAGGGSNPSVAPRHGEIVGASAPRIGNESFGHRMMQKMGWTEGRGLGQSGEGLVDPVEQRMRFGTAGLG